METDCVHRLQTKLSIDLHPSKLRDVLGSVREQLDGLLLTYRADLSGVVLTYSNEKILNKTAHVHGFFPYFHIDVSADLQVFKLFDGQQLVGTVNKVGEDFIGLLVLGVFNAVVKKEDMPDRFEHDQQAECWASMVDAEHRICEHSQVVFTVKSVEILESHFAIEGHLRGEGNGAVDFSQTAKKRKKKHKSDKAENGDAPTKKHKANKAREGVTPNSKDREEAAQAGAEPEQTHKKDKADEGGKPKKKHKAESEEAGDALKAKHKGDELKGGGDSKKERKKRKAHEVEGAGDGNSEPKKKKKKKSLNKHDMEAN